MTDKQIIDGIDVSKCLYSRTNNKMIMCKACNSGIGSPYCEYETNCYYKQLKRAEQKLEKIKEHLETVSYLAPFSTRVLKHSIKTIIEE